MLEIKLTIEAAELVNALGNLAAAMGGVNARITPQETSQAASVSAATYPAPSVPVQTVPTAATGYPAPSAPVQTAPATAYPAAGVPLAQPPQYTTEQIMSAGATLVDAGRVQELMDLLNSFGVQAVTALKQDQLGAFATALREMGADI